MRCASDERTLPRVSDSDRRPAGRGEVTHQAGVRERIHSAAGRRRGGLQACAHDQTLQPQGPNHQPHFAAQPPPALPLRSAHPPAPLPCPAERVGARARTLVCRSPRVAREKVVPSDQCADDCAAPQTRRLPHGEATAVAASSVASGCGVQAGSNTGAAGSDSAAGPSTPPPQIGNAGLCGLHRGPYQHEVDRRHPDKGSCFRTVSEARSLVCVGTVVVVVDLI